jgi:hypothetical protein
VNLKMIMAAAVITGAFSFTALGWGAGLADAVPSPPATPVTTWPQDPGWGHGPGHGHGHGGGDWGDWGDRGGGPWYGPGWYGPGISACVSATGPWGYVTGSVCI